MNGTVRFFCKGREIVSRTAIALLTANKYNTTIRSSCCARSGYLLRRYFSGDAPARASASPADPTANTVAAVPAGDKTITSPKVVDLVNKILELNVLEVNQLMFRLQTRLGISDEMLNGGGGGGNSAAASIGGVSGSAAPVAAAAAPKEAFDIKLTVVDAKAKIKIIKEVRVITGLGLAESKALVEKAPVVIKEGLKKEEADKIKKLLMDAGAGVEVL